MRSPRELREWQARNEEEAEQRWRLKWADFQEQWGGLWPSLQPRPTDREYEAWATESADEEGEGE